MGAGKEGSSDVWCEYCALDKQEIDSTDLGIHCNMGLEMHIVIAVRLRTL